MLEKPDISRLITCRGIVLDILLLREYRVMTSIYSSIIGSDNSNLKLPSITLVIILLGTPLKKIPEIMTLVSTTILIII